MTVSIGKSWLVAALCACVASSCAKKEEEPPVAAEPEPVCSETSLKNIVPASPWAAARAGFSSYVYDADLEGGLAMVELMDDDGVLGTMVVRQLFGADVPDGSMEAVLDPDSEAPLRLVSNGFDVDTTGYSVAMRVSQPGAPTLEVTAEFRTVTCWSEPDEVVGPPCAFGVPLDQSSFTLPSCGIVIDDRIRDERPPLISRLTYAVLSDEASSAPTAGGPKSSGEQTFHQLSVFDENGARSADDVTAWLAEVGLDELVGSERERFLTTAFLDRAWWRVLNQHVAHCELERAREPLAPDSTLEMSLCPGRENRDAWGAPKKKKAGTAWGDPHLVTMDGHAYDFQAAGEFVLVSGAGFEVQARFEPYSRRAHDACGDVSVTTAAATELGGHRIVAQNEPWEVSIDGEVVSPGDALPELDEGASIEVEGGRVVVSWSSGERVEFIDRATGSITVNVELPDDRRGRVEGLLGQFDGVASNDLVTSDGKPLQQPAPFLTMYGSYADSWRVTADNSLFDAANIGAFDVDGYPATLAAVDLLPAEEVAAARETCIELEVAPQLLDACVVDVVCMSDSSPALDAANARPPTSAQAPGREDIATEGAVTLVGPPAVVAPEPRMQDQCAPDPTPALVVFDEGTTTLAGDVEVDLSAPGAYEAGASSPGTIAAGAVVQTYHLSQNVSPAAGRVRFGGEVLGVMMDSVTSSDGSFGRDGTSYMAGEYSAPTSGDVVTLSADRRSVEVLWAGDGTHRVRVLVAVEEVQ